MSLSNNSHEEHRLLGPAQRNNAAIVQSKDSFNIILGAGFLSYTTAMLYSFAIHHRHSIQLMLTTITDKQERPPSIVEDDDPQFLYRFTPQECLANILELDLLE